MAPASAASAEGSPRQPVAPAAAAAAADFDDDEDYRRQVRGLGRQSVPRPLAGCRARPRPPSPAGELPEVRGTGAEAWTHQILEPRLPSPRKVEDWQSRYEELKAQIGPVQIRFRPAGPPPHAFGTRPPEVEMPAAECAALEETMAMLKEVLLATGGGRPSVFSGVHESGGGGLVRQGSLWRLGQKGQAREGVGRAP